MGNQNKIRRFSIVALLTLVPAQAGLMVVDLFWPGHPHLIRFLLLFLAVRVVGDIVYYGLWPHRRAWVQLRYYVAEEILPFFRFGFPGAMVQRMLETWFFPNMAFGFPPSTLGEHLMAGPLLAVMIYLVNRWLVEDAQDRDRTSIRDTTHLP